MAFANSKEFLIMWSFKGNLLNKSTKNFAQLKVAVFIATRLGLNFGTMLIDEPR